MRPGSQFCRIDSILMESLPLFESLFCLLMVELRVPVQHGWFILHPYALAIRLNNPARVIQEVIRVNNADLHASFLRVIDPFRFSVGLAVLDNDARFKEVVECATQFIVACFTWHEVVKTRYAVEGRDCATVVARDAAARVADQEGEMEVFQYCQWYHCGVIRLGGSAIWVRRGAKERTVGVAICTNPLFWLEKTGGDARWVAVGW